MHVPHRIVDAARPTVPAGLLVALAIGTATFVATPFLIPGVAEELDVDVGVAGLIATAQLAGFVIGSWLLPRLLPAAQHTAIGAIVLVAMANGIASLLPAWELLLGLRVLSGVGLGVIAWLAWREAFGDRRRTNELNIATPLVAIVTTPLVAWVTSTVGAGATFALIATASLIPLALPLEPSTAAIERPSGPAPRVRAAVLLLVALALFTTGGSSVFVFVAVIGAERLGLSALTISAAMTANSAAGLVASRLRRPAWTAPAAVFGIAVLAVTIARTESSVVFLVAVAVWGLFFFVAMPATFDILAGRSAYPEQRAGDAQAVMAVGRVVGPALGGALVSAGSIASLGWVAAALLAVSATIVGVIAAVVPVRGERPAERPSAAQR
ncbi:MAG: MFS transporter [Actinomycetota bacterium]